MSDMYNNYENNENNESESYSANSTEALKARAEEAKRAQKNLKDAMKAEKKAQKAAKKAARKERGTAKKFWSTVGFALVFGLVASAVFQVSNRVVDKATGKNSIASAEISDTEVATKADGNTLDVKEETTTNTSENANANQDGTAAVAKEVQPVLVGSDNMSSSLVQVVNEAMPSIVAITNKSVQEVMSMYGMGIREYESESAGSGIIVGQNDTELLIVTNAHVVEDANTISVSFIDDQVYEGQIKGSDEENDIAVVAVALSDISGSTLDSIKIAKIGDSDALQIGEQVVAIGNALGYGQSVTTGIVSALNRSIDGSDDEDCSTYIQTDAAINPGNSGGALLNMSGELVGINSAKLASTMIEGMGYAIPISAVDPIIDNLMNMVTRSLVDESEAGYLGIVGFSVTDEVARAYNIPKGIYISEATAGTAADRAGLQKGDVIVKFDGMSMDSINKLKERLGYYKAGETVEVVVARSDDGEYVEKVLQVTLDKRSNVSGQIESADESSDDTQGDAVLEEDGDSSDSKNPGGSRSGEFNFGGNHFEYSLPDNLFDIFGMR